MSANFTTSACKEHEKGGEQRLMSGRKSFNDFDKEKFTL